MSVDSAIVKRTECVLPSYRDETMEVLLLAPLTLRLVSEAAHVTGYSNSIVCRIISRTPALREIFPMSRACSKMRSMLKGSRRLVNHVTADCCTQTKTITPQPLSS